MTYCARFVISLKRSFRKDISAIYREKVTFALYCKSPELSMSHRLLCWRNLFLSLGFYLHYFMMPFLFNCGTNHVQIFHVRSAPFVFSIEVHWAKRPFPLFYIKSFSSQVVGRELCVVLKASVVQDRFFKDNFESVA